MANRRPNIILLLGIILLVAGMIGAGLTYRSMRTENLTHARTGETAVPFADTQASSSARFQPYTAGVYRVYIGPPEAGGERCSGETLSGDLARLDGIIDVTVLDPGGSVVLSASLGPGGSAGLRPLENGWIVIDSVRIGAIPESAWTLEASYCPGTPFVPSCAWAVFLLPPQEYEVGGFLAGGVMRLLSFGGLMIVGFMLIVIGGRKR